jgi:hypothetical protein
MQPVWLRVIALVLLWMRSAVAAGPVPIIVDRLDRNGAEATAAQVVAETYDGEFVATPYAAITPSRDHSVWYPPAPHPRLECRAPSLAQHPRSAGPASLRLCSADLRGHDLQHLRRSAKKRFTRHSLAILLPATLKASVPI